MKYVQGKRVELLFIDIHFMGSKLRHFVNCMGKCKIEMYFYLRRSQVYKCPLFVVYGKRMDFLVSSANMGYPKRKVSDFMDTWISGISKRHVMSWVSDFTDIWISQISVTY